RSLPSRNFAVPALKNSRGVVGGADGVVAVEAAAAKELGLSNGKTTVRNPQSRQKYGVRWQSEATTPLWIRALCRIRSKAQLAFLSLVSTCWFEFATVKRILQPLTGILAQPSASAN